MTKKIIVAEDDEDVRTAIRILLEGKDREVHEAEDGVKALELAQRVRPDLMVMDVMMPGKVGYQVCRELKADPETRHVYIIFLTARGPQAEAAVKGCGGDEIMIKPFDIDELRARVVKALAR